MRLSFPSNFRFSRSLKIVLLVTFKSSDNLAVVIELSLLINCIIILLKFRTNLTIDKQLVALYYSIIGVETEFILY